MRQFVILVLLTSLSAISTAQQQPEIFEPKIISDGGVFGFTLSPDGRNAFWVKSNGGRDTLVIMEAHLVNKKWQNIKPASFSGKAGVWKDIDPIFSPDGNKILFQSDRPVKDKPNRKGFDIWAVDKTKTGWGTPYHLGNTLNSEESEAFASISKSGNIYFMKQNPNGSGLSDVYVSKKVKGHYQEPVNLGAPINTSNRESNPYISPDEDYLIYFSSDSTGVGDVDLYISFKTKGRWSKPKNMGAPINSSIGEFCPFVHQKQKKIYFSRTEDQKSGRRIENIYSFPFDVEKYK